MHILELAQTSIQSLPLGAGFFDWVGVKSREAQQAIQGLLIVVGIVVALIIAWRGKTTGSAIMGVVVGGIIAAIPALIAFFSTSFQGEASMVLPFVPGF